MSALGQWSRRIWYFLNRRRLERELDLEMASHRAMMAEPGHFGSTLRLREQSADVWGWTWMDDLCHDLRYASRLLVKDWRFTLATVGAVALGLAATTTAFTFVNGAVLRDLPLANPDRLVWIRTVDAHGRQLGVSYADVRDWRETARTLSRVVVSLEFPINVSEDTLAPQRYDGSYISFDVFRMVGRAPMLGRSFLPDDDRAGAPPVALISHTVWQNRYGGDPSIVGRTVRVNGTNGTDHGTASLMFVMGGAVKGGRIAGDWPGLGRLQDDRDLRVATDSRGVMKAILRDHLGLDGQYLASRVFPDTAQIKPMDGLLRA